MVIFERHSVDLLPIIQVSGEATAVPVGAETATLGEQAALNLPLDTQYFVKLRRMGGSVSRTTAAACHAWADSIATVELPSYWQIGSQPVFSDHMFLNDGWESPASGQFSFAFPIEEEVPFGSGTFQQIERTVIVQTTSGPATLVMRLIAQVQSSY